MVKKRKKRGVPVWEHLPNGKLRKRWLKSDHVCTKECLRMNGNFSYCAKYSYAG